MKEFPKRFEFKDQESIYKMWQDGKYFEPKKNSKKKPFTIIMPPPNANGSLHVGHAVFVTLEDIMIRYNRMLGKPTLWLPGADHAGIQTQVVYEKKLRKEGKSRYDLGREKFFQETYNFTMENKSTMENQLKKLGASCDWTREHFTLEPEISKSVFTTFKKLYNDGLIYRDKRIINWCPRCATALSDIEVVHKEQKDPLYYIKYGPLSLATVRPETKFGDTAVAVNPKDKRYKKYIDQEIRIETVLGPAKIKVIADDYVDPEFGTGVVKITPGHDINDFEVGKRHNLEIKQVIDKKGRMNDLAGPYAGMKITEARAKVVEDMKEKDLIDKIDEQYTHSIATCERCKANIEPLISEQWFVKIKPLATKAMDAVKTGKISFHPKRYEKVYFNWMENIRDWCISRQIWWGHRIPVYYCQDCNEIMVESEKPKKCKCGSSRIEQDEDTLDTWFSSGQWPFNTLKTKKEDFEYFYPTSVMETGFDILFFWVARMIMLGIYSTGKIPFKDVVLHGLVRDKDRVKMSKSKGNVVDPLAVVEEYGADALRMTLVFGTGIGNDIVVSEEKIRGMRNFTTKIWNASRFVLSNIDKKPKEIKAGLTKEDKWILNELKKTTKKITDSINKYQFHQAAEEIYSFFWYKFCDKTIEQTKERIYGENEKEKETAQWILYKALTDSLKLLHPFVPFVTESIWQRLEEKDPLIVSSWPKEK